MLGISKVLHSRTSKYINRVIVFWIISWSTKPTPLIVTLWTCHMIAPWYFFNSDLTLRAITNFSRIRCPVFVFFVHSILTSNISMPFWSTIKTNHKSTSALHSSFLSFLNIVVTIWSWTPFQWRIKININIFFKLEILIIYFLWP